LQSTPQSTLSRSNDHGKVAAVSGPDETTGAESPPDDGLVETAEELPELPSTLVLGPTALHVVRATAFFLIASAAVFMWLDDRFGWLDYKPGGTAFFTYVRPVFYVVLVVGALVAVRWELVGGVIGAFAAGAIGTFALEQLVGRHALLVIGMLAVPASLWVLIDLNDWSRRTAFRGLAAATVAVVAGAAVGNAIYERAFGPTHPESSVEALPASEIRWVWSGGVTTSQAELRARLEDPDAVSVRLAVSPSPSFDDSTWFEPHGRDRGLVMFTATGLAAATRYHYAVEVDGVLDLVRTGQLTTFPAGPASFRFTVGGCARIGSNGAVFDAITADEPLFHVIAGDFHYGNIPDDDRERYDEVIDLTLRQPAQFQLYRSTPVAYMWDDHDYGVDGGNASSPSRSAAMDAYRGNVPSYPLAGTDTPIYQRFDVGRVRFLLTDGRSGRIPGETMLGAQQLEWFLDELAAAPREAALVVWVNPLPWVAEEADGADHWGGYPAERRRIANVIAAEGIDNLLMISGDAHMVAIDDGTNTNYSTTAGPGFPLIHAAPLDRKPSIKGGPYSVGVVAKPGQYARIDVTDDGRSITVDLEARRYDGATLLSYRFEVPPG
jgi:phosphodiesterase/alkaline phosphatase D-like protein